MIIKTLKTKPLGGVYILRFPDGTSYIGASKDLSHRLANHADPNRPNTPCNRNGHNPDDVEAEILCHCKEEHLRIFESLFIRAFKPEHNWRDPADDQLLADKRAEYRRRQKEVEKKGAFWASFTPEDKAAWREAARTQDFDGMSKIAAKYKKPKRPRGRPPK